MPSNYKRKSTQQNWDSDDMKDAIEAVQNGEMGFLKASKTFDIPRSTLKRRVNNKNVYATGTKKILGCFRNIFTPEQETELVNHIFEMEKIRLTGISLMDIRSLAYELAESNNLQHRFSSSKRLAGKDWWRGFRQRHPEIVIKKQRSSKTNRDSVAVNNPKDKPAPPNKQQTIEKSIKMKREINTEEHKKEIDDNDNFTEEYLLFQNILEQIKKEEMEQDYIECSEDDEFYICVV